VSEALGVIRQFWALEQERRAAREQPSAIRHQIWEQLEVKLDALTEAGHPDLVAPVNSWVRDLLVDNKSFRAPS
jgi:vacuolar-type H+-ATPase catalytic subunit A/Vma1